jgi:AcrR family transcriptional regulator
MPDTPPRVARPRGRPPKDAQFAPTDEVMAAAIEAFSVYGYNGVSLRTVNEQLGVSRNLLYQRFGSKANLWRSAVDWAFRPFEVPREQGRIKNIPSEVVYFLLSSGGSAPYSQTGMASLMNPEMTAPEETRVRLYAENVAELLLNGLSLSR